MPAHGWTRRRPYCPGCQGPHPLTHKQDTIINLIAEGWTNLAIANRLIPPTTPKTVEYYCGAIYRSIGVNSHPDRTPRIDALLWWQRHEAIHVAMAHAIESVSEVIDRALGVVSSP